MPPPTRYSLRERLYFGAVIAAGCSIAGKSAAEVVLAQLPSEWLILGALTLLTGSFTIKIPRLSIRISVSDAFVFASVLLYGGAAATSIVAVDSVVATLWMRRENRSLFRSAFNLAAASLSIFCAAAAFDAAAGPLPPPGQLVLTELLWPLFLLAGIYFLLNTWLIAIALSIERQIALLALWWKHFLWLSLNYFGGVSAAALLVSYTRSVDIGAVSIILPLLAISYLTYRTSLGRVQDAQKHLEQVNDLYMSTIEALAMAVDAKDQITHGHIRRVQVYAVELAKRLGVTDAHQLMAIETAALLHDMGKLAIPEHILNKPGKLTTAEFDKMKRHADIGADLLSSIKFPYPVVPIVRHHHENWDGSGYPANIAGPDIPLGARILSVVDCFDALTSDRPYRPKLSDEDAFAIISERRSTMYDPLVVDTFVRVYAEIAPAAIKAGQDARSMLNSTDALTAADPEQDGSLGEIRSSAYENSVLSELRDALKLSTTDVDAAAAAASCLKLLIPASVYVYYRYDTTRDMLTVRFSLGDERRLTSGIEIRTGERITGWTAATLRLSLNSDAHLDLGALADAFDPPLSTTLSASLTHGGALLGVLSIYGAKTDAFTASHRYIIEHVSNLLAASLSGLNERQHGQVVAFRASTR